MLNLKKLILLGSTGAIIAVSSLTGCQSSSSSSSERSAGRQMDDKTISETVVERLKHEPVYKFTDVDVRTFDGVVQLSGFVTSEGQKNRAAQIAQTVPGVNRVINNISLKPEPLTPTGQTQQY